MNQYFISMSQFNVGARKFAVHFNVSRSKVIASRSLSMGHT